MPLGAIYVGRPGKFGNPYRPGKGFSEKKCLRAYRMGVRGRWTALQKFFGHDLIGMLDVIAYFQRIRRSLPELRGKDLCCWCPLDQPCHGDILLELANKETT